MLLNNKPLLTPTLKALGKKQIFRAMDKVELKMVQRELRRKIGKGKGSYRGKLEERLQQNISREIPRIW